MKALIGFMLIALPLKNLKVNSRFGYRIHPISGKYEMHAGVDLKAHKDTVYAILDGQIESVGYHERLGVNVRIWHHDLQSVYGHLSKVFVVPGESVSAGQPIAITGATGTVTGEHLHFSIYYKHKYINPLQFLYQLLKKQEHEQKFQSTSDSAFRQADCGNQRGKFSFSKTS